MDLAVNQTGTEPTGHSRASSSRRGPRLYAVAAICLLAGILYVLTIGSASQADPFYLAAVRSMSHSFTNFLFGSYDQVGLVTVDKQPMALWPQVISVWIFGYHPWAVLLPQVLEGVAAVFLLHRAVRLWAGENVALLAAFVLAVTPVTVAINRDNHPDTLLVLFLVAAAYAFSRSVQAPSSAGRTRWLMAAAAYIGCGFVTKMLEAWIIVPAVAIAFLVGVDGPVRRRVYDVLGAAIVLVVSSFWWTALHDLWPGAKPYMGGSTDGTALQLALGYNGFGRLFGSLAGGSPASSSTAGPGYGVLLTPFGGNPGIARMFNSVVGGQISWLLPFCLLILAVVAIAGARRVRGHVTRDLRLRAGWVLWGTWLVTTALVFDFTQGDWHAYYTAMLAPAVAAIAAMGLATLWRIYRADGGAAWILLPASIALSAAWAFVLISRNTAFNGWARWVVVVAAVAAVGGLVAARTTAASPTWLARPSAALGVAAIMITPLIWSASTGTGGDNPTAGPWLNPFVALATQHKPSGGRPGPAAGGRSPFAPPPGFGGGQLTPTDRKVLAYAEQHSGSAQIALAVEGGALNASRFIINADKPVVALGGFAASDNVPSVGQLQQWVADGKLRFVLGSGLSPIFMTMSALGGPADNARNAWITQHCRVVDPHAYGATSAPQPLYFCG